MKLRYNVTAEDLQAFYLHRARSTADGRAQTAALRLFATLGMFYFVLGTLVELGGPGAAPRIIAFVLALLCFFVAPLGRRGPALRHAKARWRQIGPHELEVLPEVLIDRGPAGELRTPWSQLERIETNTDRAYIYLDGENAHIVRITSVGEHGHTAFIQALRERFEATPRAFNMIFQAPAELPLRHYLLPIGGAVLVLSGLCLCLLFLLQQVGMQPPIIPRAWPYSWLIGAVVFFGIGAFCFVYGWHLVRKGPHMAKPLPDPAVTRLASGFYLAIAAVLLAANLHGGLERLPGILPALLTLGLGSWFCWEASRFQTLPRRAN